MKNAGIQLTALVIHNTTKYSFLCLLIVLALLDNGDVVRATSAPAVAVTPASADRGTVGPTSPHIAEVVRTTSADARTVTPPSADRGICGSILSDTGELTGTGT